jgi:replication initiator protein RepSA/uncharacterized protein DUF5919
MICQQVPDQILQQLIDDGARFRCLFLAPQGQAIREREREEGHRPGGYGGHFFTKSRRYTGTFTAERNRRIAWRRTRAVTSRLERAGAVDLVDEHAARTTDVLTELVYVGIGWHTTADAVLANTAAAMARERRQHARDATRTA